MKHPQAGDLVTINSYPIHPQPIGIITQHHPGRAVDDHLVKVFIFSSGSSMWLWARDTTRIS